MNRRILIIVLSALVLSICASYLVYRAVGTRVAGTAVAPHTVQLVSAARDLEIGTVIQTADLKMIAWNGPLPKGAIIKEAALLDRGVASTIYEGEPLTESRLAIKGSGGGLAATIPPGMRACAVRVNEVVGVAGFVVPGMRVDVLITGVPPGGNPSDGARVRTLLQNIQVLSAGTNFQKDQQGKPEQAQVVNLLVAPAQAEILSLAGNETKIQLILRNPMDTELSKPPGTAMSDLFGGTPTPATAAPARPEGSQPVKRSAASAIPATAAPALPAMYVIKVSNGAVQTEAKFAQPAEGQK